MAFEDEKKALAEAVQTLEKNLKEKKRRLEKLDKVQEDLSVEPAPGTVLRFSRSMAGSSQKYTFVAFRSGPYIKSWHLTGKANALRLLGLTEGANSWQELVVAIGDAKVKIASEWVDPGAPNYLYFQGFASSNRFRVDPNNPRKVEIQTIRGGEWRENRLMSLEFLAGNPGSYRPISL